MLDRISIDPRICHGKPCIKGAFAQDDTIEEAIFNCVDVVKMIAAYRAERRVANNDD